MAFSEIPMTIYSVINFQFCGYSTWLCGNLALIKQTSIPRDKISVVSQNLQLPFFLKSKKPLWDKDSFLVEAL